MQINLSHVTCMCIEIVQTFPEGILLKLFGIKEFEYPEFIMEQSS